MAGKDIKALFLAHERELQVYLTRKLRDADTAADLTQETFLRFAEQSRCNSIAGITHERSYLYRTAHNLAVDYIRRERRRKTDRMGESDLIDLADDCPSPERTVAGHDELTFIRQALTELPERTQQVFKLARIDGLTYPEVAKQLRISDSSVQKHLAKATKHVMQRLRKKQRIA